MDLIEKINDEYRSRKNHGVTFSIDSEAYECECDVEFGKNSTEMQCGTLYNWQPIIIGGKEVGYVEESQSGKLFDPMCVSFCVPLADCMEHELWDAMAEKHKDNPHLCDCGESLELRFATLRQLLGFLGLG